MKYVDDSRSGAALAEKNNIMTSTEEEANVCASCGKAEVNSNITLKKCSACKSVRYCGVACQKNHMPQHKRACKKRVEELREQILFRQPESSHLGDCPVCFLPLSLDMTKNLMHTCCSKILCHGCAHSNYICQREVQERTCPFCRQPIPETQAEGDAYRMRRVEVNDPVAIRQSGAKCFEKGDYVSAFEYWTKAAGLGDTASHYELSIMYREGQGVEKDKKKELYHSEVAAIGGNPDARHNLGWEELNSGRKERAGKHFTIAANLGFDPSIKMLKKFYAEGVVTKEEFAAALRAYQAAVDATKSAQRKAAEQARTNQG